MYIDPRAGRLAHVSAQALDWRDALKPGHEPRFAPVSLLLVCDCNYYSSATVPLVATILAYLEPGGTLALASRVGRAGLSDCLEQLRAAHELEEDVEGGVSFPTHEGVEDRLWIYRRREREPARVGEG